LEEFRKLLIDISTGSAVKIPRYPCIPRRRKRLRLDWSALRSVAVYDAARYSLGLILALSDSCSI
jgi:hypothetical protein